MANIGYIRYSVWEENPKKQLESIKLDKVFEETSTSSAVNRPELIKCIEFLKKGDTLHIQSIDRIARNMSDLQDLIDKLINKGVIVRFLAEDMKFSSRKLLCEQEMFSFLDAYTSFEKNLAKDRQREGIYKAQLEGKSLGRPRKISKKLRENILAELEKGVPRAYLAKKYNISVSSIYKL